MHALTHASMIYLCLERAPLPLVVLASVSPVALSYRWWWLPWVAAMHCFGWKEPAQIRTKIHRDFSFPLFIAQSLSYSFSFSPSLSLSLRGLAHHPIMRIQRITLAKIIKEIANTLRELNQRMLFSYVLIFLFFITFLIILIILLFLLICFLK